MTAHPLALRKLWVRSNGGRAGESEDFDEEAALQIITPIRRTMDLEGGKTEGPKAPITPHEPPKATGIATETGTPPTPHFDRLRANLLKRNRLHQKMTTFNP
jgi:hypothetical protein